MGYRYEVKKFLGKGSFGTCVLCRDHKTGEDIALKVVKNKKKYYY
jgi:dual specificity tyrosine-phosphorylation-regulated kinase 2/3/4